MLVRAAGTPEGKGIDHVTIGTGPNVAAISSCTISKIRSEPLSDIRARCRLPVPRVSDPLLEL